MVVPSRWRRRGSDNERGATMVEAALVLPFLVLLLFGILEWGLAFKTALTVTSATRSGARTGTAIPRQTDYQDAVAGSVTTAVKAMLSSGDPEELWIFKANSEGYPEGFSDFSGCESTKCYRYTWDGTQFVEQSGYAWLGSSQNACAGAADEMGVYLKVRHRFVTGVFGDDRVITEHTVMRLEPIPASEPCAPLT